MNFEEIPLGPPEELSFLVETLRSALSRAYSISSSPVEPLIEVMVDIALQLKKTLKEGLVPWELKSNKSLKFSETKVDSLANPLVISTEKQRHTAWDPQLSNFFGELAKDLILVKRLHDLPQNLYSYGKARKQDCQPGQQRIKAAEYHFFRRQSRKSKKD